MEVLTPNSTFKVLHFLLEDTHVCIDLQSVIKILPLAMIEQVPGGPSYLVGLINVAGQTIPVIDLAMRLGLERTKSYTTDISILLCTSGSYQAGLVIDQILKLDQMNINTVQLHDDFDKAESPFIGSLAFEENMSLLIDIKQILPVHFQSHSKPEMTDKREDK